MMHETFGRCLPAQFASWTDAHTDEQTANVCVYGLASWYLRPARRRRRRGTRCPISAVLESNLEYMGIGAVDGRLDPVGATAYLGAPPALADGKATLARCSACGRATTASSFAGRRAVGAREGELPLVARRVDDNARIAGGADLTMDLRERVNLRRRARDARGDHPLRRLLKQHYFGTSEINDSSKDMLLPVGQFAHRCFGFSEKGWLEYFGDVVAEWKWTPLPEKLRASGCPKTSSRCGPSRRRRADVARARDKFSSTFGTPPATATCSPTATSSRSGRTSRRSSRRRGGCRRSRATRSSRC